MAYDNGSRGDHAWLRVARHYARRGLLTLVDWPYQLGGEGTTGNNVAQRAQLSHAAFAFSPRVAWLGTFDVDEFFVPAPLGKAPQLNASIEALLDGIDAPAFPNEAFSVVSPMRNAQAPDTCRTSKGATTRLAACAYLCGNQNLTARSIDATPARWRGGVRSSPLDRARTATSSPRKELCTRRTG